MPLFGRSDKIPEPRTSVRRARTPEPPATAGETEEPFGLFELWPNTPSGEASRVPTVMDIVAVHGLGGHPYKTWTEVRLRDIFDLHTRTRGHKACLVE